jgi:hypothetical protein
MLRILSRCMGTRKLTEPNSRGHGFMLSSPSLAVAVGSSLTDLIIQ